MLIDTHTHIYLPEFDSDRDQVMARARQAGVEKMIFPNVDLSTIEPMKRLHDRYPDNTFMAMGLHPTEVGPDFERQLQIVTGEYNANPHQYVAIGEIGIDLYWDKTYRDLQMQAFDRQVTFAESHNLPIIIHCREALDEVLEVMQDHRNATGVMHSFGGTEKDVDRVRSVADLHFGINGIVTFKNSRLRDTLPAIGLDRLLIETDSPYLAPVPHRGKRNESAFVAAVAHHIAETLSLDIEEVATATTAAATSLFRI